MYFTKDVMDDGRKEYLDRLTINNVRILSVEMIQKANSGHPGLPLGAAPMLFSLWAHHMKFNPDNPKWINRDRFVLSAGHGSALLYSLLYLFGYDISLNDLKNFRQLNSRTPGHPEYGITPGVEVTTGPLGQGIANAVGMAFAESYLANKFNRNNYKIIDHFTFVLCGDGCLMEGISQEAISLAGTLKLGKLIVLYDSNGITIEGKTKITFNENITQRFQACNWHVQTVSDGNNLKEINIAIANAKLNLSQPSLIEIKTLIGYGVPNKEGSPAAHGEPLSSEEIKLLKNNLDWSCSDSFVVKKEVHDYMNSIKIDLIQQEQNWKILFNEYSKKYCALAQQLDDWHNKIDNINIEDLCSSCDVNDLSTRDSSGKIINKIANIINNIVGGSADLAPSTKSIMHSYSFYSCENKSGSNLHFGIREHAMAAFANGVILHGGLKIFIAGFLSFSDYMKPAIRLAAMMRLSVIYVFTHDSIGVGEDGPTHQPIEQLAMLRSIINLIVIRPCDYRETMFAWECAINNKNAPTAIILSRQTLPALKNTGAGLLNGAYVLLDSDDFQVILMASGSEVHLVCEAYNKLKKLGINARVISMASFEIFDMQSDNYKEYVMPKKIRMRIAVEAACEFGWHKYIGLDGDIICMKSFGASAPSKILLKKYNFTVDHIVQRVLLLLR